MFKSSGLFANVPDNHENCQIQIKNLMDTLRENKSYQSKGLLDIFLFKKKLNGNFFKESFGAFFNFVGSFEAEMHITETNLWSQVQIFFSAYHLT